MAKKKSIVDISNASAEVLEIIEKNYPNGYDQATNLVRYNNTKGDLIVALPIETDDTEYLVKVNWLPVSKLRKNWRWMISIQ
jgi:hypothetical protein